MDYHTADDWFLPRYLDADEERMHEHDAPLTQHALTLMKEYEKRERCDLDDLQSLEWSNENYESSASQVSKVFKQFQKRYQMNEGQVIRYHRGGEPLFYGADAVYQTLMDTNTSLLERRCTRCRQPLQFEVQLMPSLLNYLKLKSDGELNMEWACIFVYTCAAECYSQFESLEQVEAMMKKAESGIYVDWCEEAGVFVQYETDR
jgi:hypothetical protein